MQVRVKAKQNALKFKATVDTLEYRAPPKRVERNFGGEESEQFEMAKLERKLLAATCDKARLDFLRQSAGVARFTLPTGRSAAGHLSSSSSSSLLLAAQPEAAKAI